MLVDLVASFRKEIHHDETASTIVRRLVLGRGTGFDLAESLPPPLYSFLSRVFLLSAYPTECLAGTCL